MLLEKYIKTRKHTEDLCEPLNIEDYVPQSADFTSPPKWHLAHVSWFFEEMILTKYPDADKDQDGDTQSYQVFDEAFNFLFNSYYQTVGERAIRAQRGLITRPTVEHVYAYRKHVDQHMQRLLSNETELTPELFNLVVLGLNHEQQHQELLITDLKYTFAFNSTFPVYKKDADYLADSHSSDYTSNEWVCIQEGVYEIGYQGNEFCFDNELGVHKTYLHDYDIAKGLVTNAEYIEFIEDGAYDKFEYWLDEGWNWINEQKISNPLYWQKIDGQWYQYTLSGLQQVNPEAVLAHVSYYEANAYATWKGCRLPTEFEWEIASDKFNWGVRWEWTASAYQAYPGFSIGEGAVGEYNGKFMVNQMVLRGASLATAEGHSRATYRNFFHPHFQWQFSGIRLAR